MKAGLSVGIIGAGPGGFALGILLARAGFHGTSDTSIRAGRDASCIFLGAGRATPVTELDGCWLDGLERLDPALRAIATTRTDFSLDSIKPMREPFNQRRRECAEHTDAQGVQIVDDTVAAESGSVRSAYLLAAAERPAPAVVYCHAGGFALGNLDTDHRQCVELARRGAARWCRSTTGWPRSTRIRPPSTTRVAVLRWVAANATELDVDAARLAVAGSSAGATLAACLAHGAADGSLPTVVFQLLHQPVLDDRETASKAEFCTSPGFRQRGGGSDVALLPGPRRWISGRRARAAKPIASPATRFDHVRGDRSLSRRSGRLCAAAASRRGFHRATRISAHLPWLRLAAAGLVGLRAVIRPAGSSAAARVWHGA